MIPASQRFPNARRRLFEDETKFQDSETSETDNSVNEFIQQSNQEAQERWNFDFINEQPLEGNWVWEKIEETTTTNNVEKVQNKG